MARMSNRVGGGGPHSEHHGVLMLPPTSPSVAASEDHEAAAQLYAIGKSLQLHGGGGAGGAGALYGSSTTGGIVFNTPTSIVAHRRTDDGRHTIVCDVLRLAYVVIWLVDAWVGVVDSGGPRDAQRSE